MPESVTEKLYLDQPYRTAFEATVVSSRPLPDGAGHAVVLDRTLFYPESGGQLSDTGLLASARVTDVREADDDTVVHTVASAATAGAVVSGAIDWARRFDHMQQHTGQHVLSRAFIEAAGLHTVSFHMGEETCTIDLEGAASADGAAPAVEELANRIVAENRPVDVSRVPVEDLDHADLRRKVPEGVRVARIVSVRDFDSIPCCGTHVRTTGELGVIKLLKSEKVRQYQRVHFKVGLRALADYRDKHQILQSLSKRLTTAPADVIAKVERLLEESQSGARRSKALVQRLAAAEKLRLLEGATRVGALRVVVYRDADPALARALAGELQSEPSVVAVVGADDGSVVCTASPDTALDLAGDVSAIARELGGSGGGKGGFVQLKLAASRVDEALRRIDAHVRSRIS